MICKVYRWLISGALDASGAVPGFVRIHLRRCPGCSSFYEQCLVLSDRLETEIPSPICEVTDQQRAKIVTRSVESRPTGHVLRIGRGPLVVAACFAIVAGAVGLYISTTPDSTTTDHYQAVGEIRKALVHGGVLPEGQSTWTFGLTEPLESELGNLTADAHAAVRFLIACSGADIVNSVPHQIPN